MDNKPPMIGDAFPSFEANTTQGTIKLPQFCQGKWMVFFSHPGDFTPVCTSEFVAFQKRIKDFKALNTELIGLSVDQLFSHIKWIMWIKEKINVDIEFPVIADITGDISRTLGLIHPTQGLNTVRGVYVVNPRGIIRATIFYPPEVGRSIDEILRLVKALQVSEKQGVVLPEGWPNNEIVGKKALLPPAHDVKTAIKRAKEKGCLDWWFCPTDLKK